MVKVYLADLCGMRDPLTEPRFELLIGPALYKEVLSYKRKENRIEQCGKWLLLIKALKESGVDFFQEELLRTGEGKPYLKSGKVKFNLSHSGTYVMCVISDLNVGCDVDHVRVFRESLLKRCYSEAERSYAGEDALSYTKLWTLKESFFKWLGIGLVEDLRGAEFSYLKKEDGAELYELKHQGFVRKEKFYVWQREDYVFSLCISDDFDGIFDNLFLITYNDIC